MSNIPKMSHFERNSFQTRWQPMMGGNCRRWLKYMEFCKLQTYNPPVKDVVFKAICNAPSEIFDLELKYWLVQFWRVYTIGVSTAYQTKPKPNPIQTQPEPHQTQTKPSPNQTRTTPNPNQTQSNPNPYQTQSKPNPVQSKPVPNPTQTKPRWRNVS